MRKQYDFSAARKNPYAAKLKQPVTIRLDQGAVACFKSLDPAIEEAWRIEIRRRVASYERGEAVLYDAEEVMAEAKRLAP